MCRLVCVWERRVEGQVERISEKIKRGGVVEREREGEYLIIESKIILEYVILSLCCQYGNQTYKN